MQSKEYFPIRLKMLRSKRKMSQGALAEALGISRGTISFYENGDRLPDIETLENISNYFGVSYNYLLGKTDIADETITRHLNDIFANITDMAYKHSTIFFAFDRIAEILNKIDFGARKNGFIYDRVCSIFYLIETILSDLQIVSATMDKNIPIMQKLCGNNNLAARYDSSDIDAMIVNLTKLKIGWLVRRANGEFREFYHALTAYAHSKYEEATQNGDDHEKK